MTADQQSGEIERLRVRLHEHAAELQTHEIRLATMSSELSSVQALVESSRLTMSAMVSSAQLDGHVRVLTLQLEHLRDDLMQIKKVIYGGIAMVLSAVLLAALSLVLR